MTVTDLEDSALAAASRNECSTFYLAPRRFSSAELKGHQATRTRATRARFHVPCGLIIVFAASALMTPTGAFADPTKRETTRTVVLDFKPESGVDANLAQIVTDALVSTLQERAGVPIITAREVILGLGFEQRKLIACNNRAEESCMAEIGGALGADFLVFGSIAKVGNTFALSAAAFDERRAIVLRRYIEKSANAGEASLLVLANEGGRYLAPVLPGSRAIDEPPASHAPPPLVAEKPALPPAVTMGEPPGTNEHVRAAGWWSLGGGVALLAGGGVFQYLAEGKDHSIKLGGFATSADIQGAYNSARTYRIVSVPLMISGGAAVLLGATLVVTHPAAPTTVAVTIEPHEIILSATIP